jgi:ArsR family transcriptional regulator
MKWRDLTLDEKILKALCEPKRFLLLTLMAERGYCVRALARLSCLSESAVSQHLKVLREAGLVYGVKRGYYTHYCLDKKSLGCVIEALELLRDTESRPCERPFYGCSEAEHLKCKAYVPPEERRKEKEKC